MCCKTADNMKEFILGGQDQLFPRNTLFFLQMFKDDVSMRNSFESKILSLKSQ